MTNPGKQPELSRGERFAHDVREQYELSLAEDCLVTEVARTLDTLDVLPLAAVVEARLQRVTLARLLSCLALPEPGSGERPQVDTQRARKAARSRWGPTHA